MLEGRSYNDRLFSGGIRGYFHLARFRWVREQIERFKIPTDSVLELGCFDGRLLDFIPRPSRYVGMDANWEGGLDLARAKFAGIPNYTLLNVKRPEQIALDERFTLGAALETLEHVPPDAVDGYLREIASRVDYFVATIPNETGPVLLAKWLTKTALRMTPEKYSAAELFNATIFRMDRVRRFDHKGFDYRSMIRQIGAHFDVIEVQGFPLMPAPLCFSVGIVARRGIATHTKHAR